MGVAPHRSINEIERLRARDEDAWREFHDHEFPVLYRFALGMGAEPELAEDCASEAFVRLVREVAKLRLDSAPSVRAWLIVTCRNYLRDQMRRRRGGTTPLDTVDVASPDLDPLTRVALTSALAALPDQQREVVVMRFVLDMPMRDVAAASGRSVKATESLQHRALGSLRRSPALRPEDA